MASNKIIHVQGVDIQFFAVDEKDYISLTDMVKNFGDSQLIYNWMKNRSTLEYLGAWEQIYNLNFSNEGFDDMRIQSGFNAFTLTPKKWIDATGAIGFISKAGRYGGGIFAHKDLAFEFGTWLSPVFKLYLIREFQVLKDAESKAKNTSWDLRRELAKINYLIHTDAVKDYLIPPRLLNTQSEGHVYANEADMLNLALFGKTARQWKADNPEAKGNMRDNASAEQLLVLANLENLNAEFIKQGLDGAGRIQRLNEIAIYQMNLLLSVQSKVLSDLQLPTGTKTIEKPKN
jgi:KilA-N domain